MEWYEHQGPLKQALHDWVDVDVAMFHLAVCLGLLDPGEMWGGRKDVFCSNNAIGNYLFKILHKLVELGVLEFSDGKQQVRWCPSFVLE